MTGQIFTWTGAHGTDWSASNPTNWQTPGVPPTQQLPPSPDTTDVAVINKGGAVSVSGGGGAGELQIVNGTAVTVSGNYSFGGVGPGSLQIDDGGSLTVPSGATVSDGYKVSDEDDVGINSVGTMTIENGGGYRAFFLDVGAEAGASGTVTVDGATAFEIVRSDINALNGLLIVGESGDGTVDVSDTLFFTTTAIVGRNAGSNGQLTVDGTTWGGNDLDVGEEGTGTVTIEGGSAVAITTITIGAAGKLVVTGGAAGATSSVLVPDLTLSFGTIDVSGFGQVSVGANVGVDGAVSIGGVTLPGLGTINGDVVVQSGGVLEAEQPIAGTLLVNGDISGVGTIEPVMTLEANGAIAQGVTIEFSPSVGAAVGDLILDEPTAEKGTIIDFGKGNEIDVRGYQYTTAVFAQGAPGEAGTLTLSGGSSAPLQLAVEGDYAPNSFKATPGFSNTSIPNTIVTLDPTVLPNNDFNDDGKSDNLFRNDQGVSYLWEMSGSTVANGATTSTQVGENWQVEGVGDFNGDGTADILWFYNDAANGSDPLNGVYYITLQNGPTALPSSGVVQQLSPNWQVAGIGNFNSDATSDILYRYWNAANASDPLNGDTYVDLMNGTAILSGSGFTSAQVTDPNWQIAGTGDFTGNGMTDVVWRYDDAANASNPLNGAIYEWQMNGTQVVSSGLISQQPGSANWQEVGTGDFDGNGTDDILFRYDNAANASDPLNGITYIDFLNGLTVTNGAPTSWQVDEGWQVASIGDYNGDGKADILWQQASTGDTYIWMMNGANVTSGAFTSEQAGTGWTVQNGVHIAA